MGKTSECGREQKSKIGGHQLGSSAQRQAAAFAMQAEAAAKMAERIQLTRVSGASPNSLPGQWWRHVAGRLLAVGYGWKAREAGQTPLETERARLPSMQARHEMRSAWLASEHLPSSTLQLHGKVLQNALHLQKVARGNGRVRLKRSAMHCVTWAAYICQPM